MRWIDAVKLFALGCLLGAAVGANARGQDDATRFAGELNAVRAARGLPASVAVSPTGAASASRNNAWQQARGLGHYDTGGLAQCAAVGCATASQALSMWANSPAHAAIIFHPGLTSVGFACDGWAATAACQMGSPAPVNQVLVGPASGVNCQGGACYPMRRGWFRRW